MKKIYNFFREIILENKRILLGSGFCRVRNLKPEVLIIDESHLDFVRRCVPYHLRHQVLPLRSGIPFIFSLLFFFKLLFRLLKHGFKMNAVIAAHVDCLRPKVIISIIDNGIALPFLQNFFPEILICAIQNGVRHDHPSAIVGWKKYKKLPVYFAFGEYEKTLMEYSNVSPVDFHSIGSLKGGVFLEDIKSKMLLDEDYYESDLCYISQYRAGIRASTNPLIKKYFSTNEKVIKHALEVCKRCNLSIVIAMSADLEDEIYQDELAYFRSLAESANVDTCITFSPNNRKELKSYKIALESNVIVATDSTLSFELFGMGKKVLFCGKADKQFEKDFGLEILFKNMPQCFLLEDFDVELMKERIQYLLKTESSIAHKNFITERSYYMNFNTVLPHVFIKNYISNYLSNGKIK